MRLSLRVASLLVVASLAFGGAAQAQDEPKYHFVMVSHIGASDPNTTCTVQDATNQRCSASLDASGETRPATASVGAFEP